MRAVVYVDGFNLYYGCLKGTNYRWLDLAKLCDLMLPNQTVTQIKYFTAIVDSPTGSVRQQRYIQAIEADDRAITYRGHFLSHTKRRPRSIVCAKCGDAFADVVITEEKGTDVNLATHLVYDACSNAFDVAAVLSNDSDLVLPIVFARERCGKTVASSIPRNIQLGLFMKPLTFTRGFARVCFKYASCRQLSNAMDGSLPNLLRGNVHFVRRHF